VWSIFVDQNQTFSQHMVDRDHVFLILHDCRDLQFEDGCFLNFGFEILISRLFRRQRDIYMFQVNFIKGNRMKDGSRDTENRIRSIARFYTLSIYTHDALI
jgi:hypothetical protein